MALLHSVKLTEFVKGVLSSKASAGTASERCRPLFIAVSGSRHSKQTHREPKGAVDSRAWSEGQPLLYPGTSPERSVKANVNSPLAAAMRSAVA